MDISGIITNASAIELAKTRNQADVAVAAKALQAERQQGEAMVELIEQAAQVQADGLDVKA